MLEGREVSLDREIIRKYKNRRWEVKRRRRRLKRRGKKIKAVERRKG